MEKIQKKLVAFEYMILNLAVTSIRMRKGWAIPAKPFNKENYFDLRKCLLLPYLCGMSIENRNPFFAFFDTFCCIEYGVVERDIRNNIPNYTGKNEVQNPLKYLTIDLFKSMVDEKIRIDDLPLREELRSRFDWTGIPIEVIDESLNRFTYEEKDGVANFYWHEISSYSKRHLSYDLFGNDSDKLIPLALMEGEKSPFAADKEKRAYI